MKPRKINPKLLHEQAAVQIISVAKIKAEKLFVRAHKELEPMLNPALRNVREFLQSEITLLSNEYVDLAMDVTDDERNKRWVINCLAENMVRGYSGQILGSTVEEQLSFIFSGQYLKLLKINYLKKKLLEYDDYLGSPTVFAGDSDSVVVQNSKPIDISKLKPAKNVKVEKGNSPKAVIWHKALLYFMLCRIKNDFDIKDKIITGISQEYGCENGDSFYTEYSKVLRFNNRLDVYIRKFHNNTISLKNYKPIIRALPQYKKVVEKLLSELPE